MWGHKSTNKVTLSAHTVLLGTKKNSLREVNHVVWGDRVNVVFGCRSGSGLGSGVHAQEMNSSHCSSVICCMSVSGFSFVKKSQNYFRPYKQTNKVFYFYTQARSLGVLPMCRILSRYEESRARCCGQLVRCPTSFSILLTYASKQCHCRNHSHAWFPPWLIE